MNQSYDILSSAPFSSIQYRNTIRYPFRTAIVCSMIGKYLSNFFLVPSIFSATKNPTILKPWIQQTTHSNSIGNLDGRPSLFPNPLDSRSFFTDDLPDLSRRNHYPEQHILDPGPPLRGAVIVGYISGEAAATVVARALHGSRLGRSRGYGEFGELAFSSHGSEEEIDAECFGPTAYGLKRSRNSKKGFLGVIDITILPFVQIRKEDFFC